MTAPTEPTGGPAAPAGTRDVDDLPPGQQVTGSVPGTVPASGLGTMPGSTPPLPPGPPPTPPPAAPALTEPRSGVVRNAFIGGAAVFGLFLSGLASDLLASLVSGGAYPSRIQSVLNVVGFVIVVVLLVVWVVGRYLERRRNRERLLDDDLVAPGPPLRPAWFRTPQKLYGRDDTVHRALDVLRGRGVVVLTGLPGSGTSAVAEAVVAALIDDGDTDAARTAPFDLRGWSTESPDDAPTIAGRLLSMFGAAEPASTDERVLENAGARLRLLLAQSPSVLVLDNVARPDQVAWLVDTWQTDGRRPWLVVAGAPPLAEAFLPECVVELDGLDRAQLREVWCAEHDEQPTGEWLDDVLDACAGSPGAVRDLAREVTRRDRHLDGPEIRDLLRTHHGAGDPRERVWLAIHERWRTRDPMSLKARQLAFALAGLPVAELTIEAMESVRQGVDEMLAAGAGPSEADLSDLDLSDVDLSEVDVIDPIQELRARGLVRQSPVGRYRMPREVLLAVRATGPADERRNALRAALPALVHRYADLSERWGVLLDVPDHAASAARWFQAEEPLLRALLTAEYAAEGVEGRRSVSGVDDELLALTLDDLARLADALDRWYVRQQQVFGAGLVHANLSRLAEHAGRPGLVGLAAARLAAVFRASGALGRAGTELEDAARVPSTRRGTRTLSALDARRHHEQALLHLDRARLETDPRAKGAWLVEADRDLQTAWECLPKNDVSGEVTTSLTMAVVYLHQGRPDRAVDRLDAAETRALEADDSAAQAHVAELRGVAAWMQGRAPVAAALWQRALTLFGELADQQSEARCLQHLGSAVVVAPELAGLLLDERHRPLDEVAAVRHAEAWLERSSRLRAGQRGPLLAADYLATAQDVRPAERVAAPALEPPPDSPPRTGSERGEGVHASIRSGLRRLARRLLS